MTVAETVITAPYGPDIEFAGVDLTLGRTRILDQVSFKVAAGSVHALVGPNGGGKSSLVKTLLGQMPHQGELTLTWPGDAQVIGYVPQALEFDRGLPMTVDDFMAAMCQRRPAFLGLSRKVAPAIDAALDRVGMLDKRKRRMGALSGGERNRLLLAKLFTRPSNVLILDEPTNDLDVETLELLEELLVSYPGTLLLISHDRAFLDAVVTSTWVFEGEGQINEYVGGYADWLRQRPEPISTVSEVPTAKAAATSAKPAKRKLSFKEQRELDAIPGKIDALEAEQAELQAALADGQLFVSDLEKATAMAQRLPLIDDELLVLLSRWEEFGGEA